MQGKSAKVLNVTGQVTYKGVIEKGKTYRIRSEGYDYYELLNGTYIPKFTCGPVFEDDPELNHKEEYLEDYNDIVNGTTKLRQKSNRNTGKKRIEGLSKERKNSKFHGDDRQAIKSGGR